MKKDFEITVIGGGPSGSTISCLLAEAGFDVCLIEKKQFPREIICGEFLSNEVTNILKKLGLFQQFLDLSPNLINSITFYFNNYKSINSPLYFQAYGMKRSVFDNFLLQNARKSGVIILQPATVINITGEKGQYVLKIHDEQKNNRLVKSKIIICAYGRKNILDKTLRRNFTETQSNLTGVKFHIPNNLIDDFNNSEIRMYLSDGIYCGINKVSDNETTVCFLENRNKPGGISKSHLIDLFFEKYKFSNPLKNKIKEEMDSILVYGTGNIYFGEKDIVKNGIYFIGDAAGVIAPLAGDGIGMGMESAYLLSEILQLQRNENLTQEKTELIYKKQWKNLFGERIRTALLLQRIIMFKISRRISYKIASAYPDIIRLLIKRTRNKKCKNN